MPPVTDAAWYRARTFDLSSNSYSSQKFVIHKVEREGETIDLPNRYRSVRSFKSLFWSPVHSQQDLASHQTYEKIKIAYTGEFNLLTAASRKLFLSQKAEKCQFNVRISRQFLPALESCLNNSTFAVWAVRGVGGGDKADESFSIIFPILCRGSLHH